MSIEDTFFKIFLLSVLLVLFVLCYIQTFIIDFIGVRKMMNSGVFDISSYVISWSDKKKKPVEKPEEPVPDTIKGCVSSSQPISGSVPTSGMFDLESAARAVKPTCFDMAFGINRTDKKFGSKRRPVDVMNMTELHGYYLVDADMSKIYFSGELDATMETVTRAVFVLSSNHVTYMARASLTLHNGEEGAKFQMYDLTLSCGETKDMAKTNTLGRMRKTAFMNHCCDEDSYIMSSGYDLKDVASMVEMYEPIRSIGTNVSALDFNMLIKLLPARLSKRLIMMYDDDLPGRLAHLEHLLKCAKEKTNYEGLTYKVMDIEGMAGICTSDSVDIVLYRPGMIALIDFTSDKTLLDGKQAKISDAYETGFAKLNLNLIPSIIMNEVGEQYRVTTGAAWFVPDKYRTINHVNMAARMEHPTMGFIKDFNNVYHNSNSGTAKTFDKLCTSISLDASMLFLDELEKKKVKTIDNEDRKIIESSKDEIRSCLEGNGIETSIAFTKIRHKLTLIKDEEIKTALSYMTHVENNVHVKDRLATKLRVPALCDKDFLGKLDVLSESSDLCMVLKTIMSAPVDEILVISPSGDYLTVTEEMGHLFKGRDNQSMNSVPGSEFCYAVRTGDRSFRACFNENRMHENFFEYLQRKEDDYNGSKKNAFKIVKYSELEVNHAFYLDKCMNTIDRKTGLKRLASDYKSTEGAKVLNILGNSDTMSGPDNIPNEFYTMNGDYLISDVAISASHDAAEAKGISVATKIGDRGKEYFIADNKPFLSVTLIKKGADTSHLKTIFYQNFYQSEAGTFVDGGFRSKSRNELIWSIKLPYVLLSVHDYTMESGADKKTAMMDCAISSINRDPSTVMMLKVRYLFMAMRGDKAKPSDTFKKAVDKNREPTFKSQIENLHFVRMCKMFICGWALNLIKSYTKDDDNRKVYDSRSKLTCLPNMEGPVDNYDYQISSFYTARAFNKFRTEKISSDSENYLALIEELEIFTKVNKENRSQIIGCGPEIVACNTLLDVVNQIEDNRDKYVKDILDSFRGGPKRYNQNFFYSHAVYLTIRDEFYSKDRDMVKALFESNVSDTFTLRGAMERGSFTPDNQSIRAASAMWEHLSEEYAGTNGKADTKWTTMNSLDKVGGSLCSLYTLKHNQYVSSSIEYQARIISKDQDGNREITVMNADMRLGCKFCETVMEVGGDNIPENIMMSTRKEDILAKTFLDEKMKTRKEQGYTIFDTNDQSRWGPNQLMNMLAHLGVVVIKNKHIRNMFVDTMGLMSAKKNKWPESLLKLFNKSVGKATSMDQYKTMYGRAFGKYMEYNVHDSSHHVTMAMGMGQGLLGSTTSLGHAAVCRFQAMVLNHRYGMELTSFVTSDDSLCSLTVPTAVHDSGFTQATYVEFRSGTLAANNIIRNKAKSFVSSSEAEVNSIYIHDGHLVAPVMKFRSALIDCGDGLNYHNDALGSLARGAEYIRKGGSVYGSYVLSAINLSLFMDQWRRHSFYEKYPGSKAKPVEFGGAPLIQPICTMCFGPLSTTAIKLDKLKIDMSLYAEVMSNAMVTPLGETTNLEMLTSTLPTNELSYYAPKSADGLFNYNKFYKYEASVEKRNALTEHEFGYGEYPVTGGVMSINDTMNAVRNRFKTKTMSEGSGHDYLDRYLEPAHSRTRATIRLDEGSVLVSALESTDKDTSLRMSLDELEEMVGNFDVTHSSLKDVYNGYLAKRNTNDTTILSLKDALGVRFANAVKTANGLALYNLDMMDSPTTAKNDNAKRVFAATSTLLVNDMDVKSGVITYMAGRNADKYFAAYGYEVETYDIDGSSISEALLKSESVMNAVNKHVTKSLSIFNKIETEASSVVSLIDSLMKNNFMYEKGLVYRTNIEITANERVFALRDSLRVAVNDSTTFLEAVTNPGFKNHYYQKRYHTTVTGELSHASDITRNVAQPMTKRIRSVKDITTYKDILAATKAEVNYRVSSVFGFSMMKAGTVGYMGSVKNSYKVQGFAGWKLGMREGRALVISKKELRLQLPNGKEGSKYTTFLLIAGMSDDDIYSDKKTLPNMGLDMKNVYSVPAKKMIRDKMDNRFVSTLNDDVEIIGMGTEGNGEFMKMGDMYYILHMAVGKPGVVIPMMRDYNMINKPTRFEMKTSLYDAAGEVADNSVFTSKNNKDEVITELSSCENNLLDLPRAVSSFLSLDRVLSSNSRRDGTAPFRAAIKNFVKYRTLTKRNYFSSTLNVIDHAEVDSIGTADDDMPTGEDDVMGDEFYESLTMFIESLPGNPIDDRLEPTSRDVIQRNIERKRSVGVGESLRNMLMFSMQDVLGNNLNEDYIQFMLSNQEKYSMNYLFWLCLDHKHNYTREAR